MSVLELAMSWGYIGLVGFGGGPAMIPLMKEECVDGRGWLTDEQFIEALALGSSLPGPIAAKMSVFVGNEVGGPLGAVVAFLAVMAPSALLMIGLASLFSRYRDNDAVAGAMNAVKPVVIGMLAWTAIELAPAGIRSWSAGILAAAAVGALALKVHPALVIIGALFIGAAFLR